MCSTALEVVKYAERLHNAMLHKTGSSVLRLEFVPPISKKRYVRRVTENMSRVACQTTLADGAHVLFEHRFVMGESPTSTLQVADKNENVAWQYTMGYMPLDLAWLTAPPTRMATMELLTNATRWLRTVVDDGGDNDYMHAATALADNATALNKAVWITITQRLPVKHGVRAVKCAGWAVVPVTEDELLATLVVNEHWALPQWTPAAPPPEYRCVFALADRAWLQTSDGGDVTALLIKDKWCIVPKYCALNLHKQLLVELCKASDAVDNLVGDFED